MIFGIKKKFETKKKLYYEQNISILIPKHPYFFISRLYLLMAGMPEDEK